MNSYSLTRNIRKDDIFGELYFTDYGLDPNFCAFDKNKKICQNPFTNVEIKGNGNVYVCCPEWSPAIIGNLNQNTFDEVWNGEKVNAFRKSMIDGSYKYCNNQACPAMLSNKSLNLTNKKIFEWNFARRAKLPKHMSFSIDKTCNLECPSCRPHKILKDPEVTDRGYNMLKTIFESIFSNPTDEFISLTVDGQGEVFHSQAYRKIFDEYKDELSDFDFWPNIKFVLCTNGTIMTPKIQKKYDYIMKRTINSRISIDAGNKETYEKVRKGGNWEILWNNLNYMYENYVTKNNMSWTVNVILQKDNYASYCR